MKEHHVYERNASLMYKQTFNEMGLQNVHGVAAAFKKSTRSSLPSVISVLMIKKK